VTGIQFRNVSKSFPDGTRALHDFNLEVKEGEFLVLVGPSGCGKSTALRMAAGLEKVTEGEILIAERVVNDVDSHSRNIAMVFQNYALYPHMSVFDNMAFGLRARKVSKDVVQERITQAADVLGLSDLLHRKPHALSGGQRQRVAMGRALVRDPDVFLLDEPLSNLDATLRVQMRYEIVRIHRRLGVSSIYVTHDQIEAMTMADRVCVLRKGEMQQVGSPEELYAQPVNLFPAGQGAAFNLGGDGGGICPDAIVSRHGGLRSTDSSSTVGQLLVGIRAEHLHLSTETSSAADSGLSMTGEVTLVERLGPEQLIYAEVPALAMESGESSVLDSLLPEATLAGGRLIEKGRAVVVARAPSNARIVVGDTVRMSANWDDVHFFDDANGLAL
jgi:multiple sugar transport system ATP-binding protein